MLSIPLQGVAVNILIDTILLVGWTAAAVLIFCAVEALIYIIREYF